MTINTDFRALCAELLLFAVEAGEIAGNEGLWPDCDPDCALIDRARALLAEPESEVPTDEELDELFTEIDQGGEALSWRAYARAVLSRWGHPTTPPAPEPGEVGELVAWLREIGDQIQPSHLAAHQRYKRAAELLQQRDVSMDYARQCNTQAVAALLALEALADAADQFGPAGGADGRVLAAEVEKARGVLARRQSPVPVFPEGAQLSAPAPAVVPIPVAERLPEPEDCDPDGYCWWFDANDGWLRLRSGDGFAWGAITHWLPAHAIPLPQAGEGEA